MRRRGPIGTRIAGAPCALFDACLADEGGSAETKSPLLWRRGHPPAIPAACISGFDAATPMSGMTSSGAFNVLVSRRTEWLMPQ